MRVNTVCDCQGTAHEADCFVIRSAFSSVPWNVLTPIPQAASARQGWECPRCHRTYAPWFPRCDRCDVEVTAAEEGPP